MGILCCARQPLGRDLKEVVRGLALTDQDPAVMQNTFICKGFPFFEGLTVDLEALLLDRASSITVRCHDSGTNEEGDGVIELC